MLGAVEGVLFLGMVVFITLVATVLLDELTELPDLIRGAIRSPEGRKSLAARVDEIEARLKVAEGKLTRPSA
jgi:hypothetical protein